jgi:5-methylcytosine-specific restriction endonuclease McrA
MYPPEHMHVRPVAYWMATFSRERREERRKAAIPQPVRYSLVQRHGLDPAIRNRSKPLRSRIWLAQGKRCYLCNREIALASATDEHVTPRSKGGRTRSNILVADGPCNVRKANRAPYPCEILYLAYVNLVVIHRAKPGRLARALVPAEPQAAQPQGSQP